MGFHRLTVPTYFGGLPGSYDYINNAVAGTPAPADGAKGAGVNAGTYFIAFGEDATSSNSNRANAALAENCDILDDYFNTSQTVLRYVDGVIGGSPTDSIAITGEIYVGGSAESPAVTNDQYTRSGLVHLTDGSGNEIVVGQAVARPLLIHDGASSNVVGVPTDGFYTNPTVQLSVTLAAGTAYRLYYLARRSNADMIANKPAELTMNQVRTIETVPSGMQLQGMDEKYRRSPTYDATPPAGWPASSTVGWFAGSGAWFKKTAHPITGFIQRTTTGLKQGTLDSQDFLLGATFASRSNVLSTDWGSPPNNTYRYGMGSGFVHVGVGVTQVDDVITSQRGPGFFGLAHFSTRTQVVSPSSDLTILEAGTTVALSVDQITLSGNNVFYKNISGDKSAYVKGIDILVLVDGSGVYYYVSVTDFSSATVGTIRYLDGSHPNLTGSFDIVEWLTPLCYSAEGLAGFYSQLGLSNTLPPEHAGFLVAEPPRLFSGGTDVSQRRYLRLMSCDQDNASKTLAWGGYDQTSPTGAGAAYVENGYLTADGGGLFAGPVVFNGTIAANNLITVLAPSGGQLNPKVSYNEPGIPTAQYNLIYESSAPNTGLDVGKHRLYQYSYNTYRTYNASWSGSQWVADVTTRPALMESLHPTYGVKRSFKRDTSSAWTTWDDNKAPSGTGFKYLAWDATQAKDSITGDNTWRPIVLTAGSVTLELTFDSAVEGDVIDLAATISFRNSTAPGSGVNLAARLEIDSNDGSGYQEVPDSMRRNSYGSLPAYSSNDIMYWSLHGVAIVGQGSVITGTLRSSVKVRITVLATTGTLLVDDVSLRADMKTLGN